MFISIQVYCLFVRLAHDSLHDTLVFGVICSSVEEIFTGNLGTEFYRFLLFTSYYYYYSLLVWLLLLLLLSLLCKLPCFVVCFFLLLVVTL
jgi:hypothetical protein